MNQAQAGYRGTTRETWFGVQSATIWMTSGWRSCDLGSPPATGRAGRPRWLACELELFGLDVEVVTIERTLVDLLGPAPRRTSGDTEEWVRRLVQHDGVLVAVEDAGPDVLSESPERILMPFRRGDSEAAQVGGWASGWPRCGEWCCCTAGGCGSGTGSGQGCFCGRGCRRALGGRVGRGGRGESTSGRVRRARCWVRRWGEVGAPVGGAAGLGGRRSGTGAGLRGGTSGGTSGGFARRGGSR